MTEDIKKLVFEMNPKFIEYEYQKLKQNKSHYSIFDSMTEKDESDKWQEKTAEIHTKTSLIQLKPLTDKINKYKNTNKAKYQLEINRNQIIFQELLNRNLDKAKNDFPLLFPNKEKNLQEYNFHLEAHDIMLNIFEKYENEEYELLKQHHNNNIDIDNEFKNLYEIKEKEFEEKIQKLWHKYPLIFENEILKEELEKKQNKINELEKKLENKGGRPKRDSIKGTITDLKPRLYLPSSKGFEQSLEISNNKKSLKIIDEKTLNDFDFTDGKITLKGRPDIEIRYQDIQTKKIIDLNNYDLTLLKSVYSAVFQHSDRILGNTIEIKRSILADYIKVNTYGKTAYPIVEKLRQFQNVLGLLSNNSVYRVLNFSSYDSVSDIITLDVGFMIKLIKEIDEYNPLIKKRTKTGFIEYKNPDHNKLLHSSIVNERNKPVVEIIEVLTTTLLNAPRELKKPIEITCQTILDRTSILKNNYENSNNNKNLILKRAFDSKNKKTNENLIIKLLKERTNTYDYFKNLKIKIVCPSSTTLKNTKITMLHDGVNAEYNYD